MTPKQLEVFISIVQLGSVTAAAAQLAMSQPSVSKKPGAYRAADGVQPV